MMLNLGRWAGGVAGRPPWAFADQILISTTNLATMVLLARGMSPTAFGGFTLIYSVLLLANGVQSGLVLQPHNILGAKLRGASYVRYTTSTAVIQLALVAGFSAMALLAWPMAGAVGWDLAPLLPALIPPLVAWQAQEFIRRVLYTEGRRAAAFGNDLVSYGTQLPALVVLWRLECLTASSALAAIAATSALAVAVGARQIRSSLGFRVDAAAIRENWHFGKWLAGSDLLGDLLFTQVFVYMASASLGVAAAGVLKAVHTIFGPTRVLASALNITLPIRFARHFATEGPRGLHQQLRRTCGVTLPLLGGYCFLTGVFAGPLLRLFYGSRYEGQAMVLRLHAAFTFVSFVALILCNALKAKGLSRPYFTSRLAAGALALPAGWALIRAWGVGGAVLGMIASYVIFNVMIFARLFEDARPVWRGRRHPGVRPGPEVEEHSAPIPLVPARTGSMY